MSNKLISLKWYDNEHISSFITLLNSCRWSANKREVTFLEDLSLIAHRNTYTQNHNILKYAINNLVIQEGWVEKSHVFKNKQEFAWWKQDIPGKT